MSEQEHKDRKGNETHLSDMSRIAKGAGITLSGTFIGKISIFLLTVYLARVFGASNVGIYFLGVTIVHTLAIFAVAGLNVGMVRYVAIYHGREDVPRIKGAVRFAAIISFLLGLFIMFLVYFAEEWIAVKLFKKPALCEALCWLVISIPFECLMRVFLSATRGLKLMHYTAIIENWAWNGLRLLLAIVLVSGFDMGLMGAFMAFWISSVASAVMALITVAKEIPLFDRSIKPCCERREILKFSLPMLFTALIYDLVSHLDVLMLGIFVSASKVGIYSVAVRILQLGQVVFMAFQPIFQPYIAELHDKKEIQRLEKLLQALTHWSVMISLPVFLSLLVFPGFFLHFFGDEFLSGTGALSILVVAFMFSTLSNLPATMIFMAGRSDLSLINNLAVLVLNALINYLLIPKMGILGAGLATGISFIILCIIRIIEVYCIMKVQPFRQNIWKPLTAGLLGISIVTFLRSITWIDSYLHVFGWILIFCTIYIGSVYLFKLDDEQIHINHHIRNKLSSILS